MVKKRTYRAVEVESLDVRGLCERLTAGEEVIVGLDVAKRKFLAALSTKSGDVLEIVRFEHPGGTRTFLRMLDQVSTNGHGPVVVMEPTGTYGDAIRHQLGQMGVAVHRVSTKHVSDCAELYDRVPSKHDAKDACVIAWLFSTGRSAPWTPVSELQRRLRALVSQRDLHDQPLRRLHSQLEPILARHFPEFESFFDISRRRTPLVVLAEYPSPAELAAAGPEAVAALVRRTSRRPVDDAEMNRLVDAARNSLGVPMVDEERQLIRVLVTEMSRLVTRLKDLDAQIAVVGAAEPTIVAMRSVLGATTAAVVVAHMGSPAQYGSAAAFEKAAGLNLREHSSGTQQGRLRISKRGPARVRKYLFLAAMRLVQTEPIVKAWYIRRRAYDDEAKMKALIAVVRKLARALVHVARGTPFDAAMLFDARRLGLDAQRSDGGATASAPTLEASPVG
jgi:transposase